MKGEVWVVCPNGHRVVLHVAPEGTKPGDVMRKEDADAIQKASGVCPTCGETAQGGQLLRTDL